MPYRRFLLVMALVVVLLGFVYPMLLQAQFRDSADMQTLVTVFGSLLALVAGLALVAHYYTLGDRLMLLLGLAFVFGGFMELLNGLLAFGARRGWMAMSQTDLHGYALAFYMGGRLLMGMIFLVAPTVVTRMEGRRGSDKEAFQIALPILFLAVATTLAIFWVGTSPEVWTARGRIGRPADLLLGALFLLAFAALAAEYRRKADMLLWWVLLSAGIAVIAQGLQSLSLREYDAFYVIGHAYMTVAYTAPIVGFPMCQIATALEQRQTVSALQEQRELFSTLLSNTPDLISLKDRSLVYQAANNAFCDFLGKSEEEVVGKTDFDLFEDEVARRHRRADEEVLRSGRSRIQDESLSREGATRWFHVLRTPVRDAEGQVMAVMSAVRDISEIKRMEQKLRVMSHTDDLTGLHNRRGFFALGEQMLRSAARRNARALLLYLDLDGMKAVNDKFGHEAGDNMLRDLAAMLKHTVRSSDVPARIGGDEFAILAMDADDQAEQALMARLEAAIAQLNDSGTRPYRMSISLGLTEFRPADGEDLDALLTQADSQMYEHKRSKRGGL